ncbi:hypothetical protein HK405_010086 [Cladochytrium tenue]|nr:hypothetical protein HK405_010086 [Cladochytrium tenue]
MSVSLEPSIAALPATASTPTLAIPPPPSDAIAPTNPTRGTGSEDSPQRELRRQIQQIQRDPTLTPAQRARRVQALMAAPWLRSQSAARCAASVPPDTSLATAPEASEPATPPPRRRNRLADRRGDFDELRPDDVAPAFHDRDGGVLGCAHYRRACKIQAPCCGEWFACRFCHDEVSDHAIVRSEVCKMMCMHCSTVQPTGKMCVNPDCRQDVARYFCQDCKLWDDYPDKTIYHWIGQGLGKDYFHCSKCNVCMAISLRGRHRCIERNLESDCPICGEFMFTSTSTVIFMPCGHCIHDHCHAEHTRSSYQCPTCLKSLADMSGYFRRLDAALTAHRMPEEYSSTVALVYCNDCELSSFAPFHFLYHRCALCAGYNTRLERSAHAAALLQVGGRGNGEQPGVAGFEDDHATAAAENLCGADPAAVVAFLNAPILRAARARHDAAAKSTPAGPTSQQTRCARRATSALVAPPRLPRPDLARVPT